MTKIEERIRAIEARLEELDRKNDLMPGTTFFIGEDCNTKGYRDINSLIKEACTRAHEAGAAIAVSEWFVQSTPIYSQFNILVGVKCFPAIRKHIRVISLKEANAYIDGERNILLRRFAEHDSHAYRYKKTISRLNSDGSSKNYMRVRGR